MEMGSYGSREESPTFESLWTLEPLPSGSWWGEHMAMGRVLGGLARRRDGGRSSLREEMARGMVEWTDSMWCYMCYRTEEG